MEDLVTVKVDPKNPRYSCFRGKMVIGKLKDEKGDNYEDLVGAII